MPSSIPAVKRERIKVKSVLSLSSKVIQKQTNVSLRTVQRIRTNLKRYGSTRSPKALQQGRPRVITPEMEEVHAFNLCVVDKWNWHIVAPSMVGNKAFSLHRWTGLLSVGQLRSLGVWTVH
jgi:hypothetical protein